MDPEKDAVEQLLQRQSELLARLADHFAPDEVDRKERRWRRYIARIIGLCTLAGGLVLGTWELGNFLYEKWEIQRMADRYAEVAQEIYYSENNVEVARDFLAKALELEEDDPDIRYLQAYIEGMAVMRNLLNLDRPHTKEELDGAHRAIAEAELLERLAPDRPEPHILKGQVYAALKDYERAGSRLQRALALDPGNDFARVRLALLYKETEQLERAMGELDKALELNPRSKWAWLWKGVIQAEEMKQWEKARGSYEKALESDPRFDMALYNIGWTLLQQEKPDYVGAEAYFERCLAVNPENALAHYGLGMTYGYQDRYEMATIHFDKALALNPMSLSALKWRGIVHYEQAEFDEALADFSKAMELDPSNMELYQRRARVYEKTGDWNKAVTDLRYASEREPENKRIWFALGAVYAKAGEPKEAIANYDIALSRDPDYAEALDGKACCLFHLGRERLAMEALDRAISCACYKKERFYLRKGTFLEKGRRYAEAAFHYKCARQTAPGFAPAWLAEAKALHSLKRYPEALEALDGFIRLQPQDEEARRLRDSWNRRI